MSKRKKGASCAARAKIAGLESFVMDLDMMLDVVMELAGDKLSLAGGVTLSGDEAERIYFTLGLARDYSRKLKEFYYQGYEEAVA